MIWLFCKIIEILFHSKIHTSSCLLSSSSVEIKIPLACILDYGQQDWLRFCLTSSVERELRDKTGIDRQELLAWSIQALMAAAGQAKQQKNPGAVVACIKQLDWMTGLGVSSISRSSAQRRRWSFKSLPQMICVVWGLVSTANAAIATAGGVKNRAAQMFGIVWRNGCCDRDRDSRLLCI